MLGLISTMHCDCRLILEDPAIFDLLARFSKPFFFILQFTVKEGVI